MAKNKNTAKEPRTIAWTLSDYVREAHRIKADKRMKLGPASPEGEIQVSETKDQTIARLEGELAASREANRKLVECAVRHEAELAATHAECYERNANKLRVTCAHVDDEDHSHCVRCGIAFEIENFITPSDAAAREEWIRHIRLEAAEFVYRYAHWFANKKPAPELDAYMAQLRAPVPAARAGDAETRARETARRIMLERKPGAALNAVIEDYPEMWAEVQGAGDAVCGMCKGKGIFHSRELIGAPPVHTEICPSCHGTGKRAGDAVCPTCKGSQLSGKFDVDGNERPCPDCGTGKRESK